MDEHSVICKGWPDQCLVFHVILRLLDWDFAGVLGLIIRKSCVAAFRSVLNMKGSNPLGTSFRLAVFSKSFANIQIFIITAIWLNLTLLNL